MSMCDCASHASLGFRRAEAAIATCDERRLSNRFPRFLRAHPPLEPISWSPSFLGLWQFRDLARSTRLPAYETNRAWGCGMLLTAHHTGRFAKSPVVAKGRLLPRSWTNIGSVSIGAPKRISLCHSETSSALNLRTPPQSKSESQTWQRDAVLDTASRARAHLSASAASQRRTSGVGRGILQASPQLIPPLFSPLLSLLAFCSDAARCGLRARRWANVRDVMRTDAG